MYLQTSRLTLRNFVESDLQSFLAYRNDLNVAKYQGWSIPYARDTGEKFISSMKDKNVSKQGAWLQFAVALKSTDELIGDLGCFVKKEDARQAAVGFTIASPHWRNGYAVEILHCLLDYLFDDMDMHRVVADCDVENIASYRTLERLGFRREAHFVKSFLFDGVYTSEYHYGLLQREWREKFKGR